MKIRDLILHTTFLLSLGVAACGSDGEESGTSPMTGGNGGAAGSSSTAGESGAAGDVDAGSQTDASPDADASAQPDALDATAVEAASACATAFWQLERHCEGGDLIAEATVWGGALELMSHGKPATCEPDEERPGHLSLVQSGLQGDFAIQVEMEAFEAPASNSNPSYLAFSVGTEDSGAAAAIMKDPMDPTAVTQMVGTVSTGDGGSTSGIQSVLGDVKTLAISRTGTTITVEFPGTSFKQTGVVSAGPLEVRLAIEGAGDLAEAPAVARVASFTITPNTSIQSDTFDCNSIQP